MYDRQESLARQKETNGSEGEWCGRNAAFGIGVTHMTKKCGNCSTRILKIMKASKAENETIKEEEKCITEIEMSWILSSVRSALFLISAFVESTLEFRLCAIR